MKPDDPSIAGEVWILRALPFEGWYKFDGTAVRATSLAFVDNRSGEVSCYRDSPASRSELMKRFPSCFLARFTALHARSCGFNVTADPVEGACGEDHMVLTFNGVATRKELQRAAKALSLLVETIDSLSTQIKSPADQQPDDALRWDAPTSHPPGRN